MVTWLWLKISFLLLTHGDMLVFRARRRSPNRVVEFTAILSKYSITSTLDHEVYTELSPVRLALPIFPRQKVEKLDKIYSNSNPLLLRNPNVLETKDKASKHLQWWLQEPKETPTSLGFEVVP